MSEASDREVVSRWLEGSPDHTVYHLAPYLDFLRAQGTGAEVLLVSREGNPQFALTAHTWNKAGFDSGYSGVVFPPTRREATLRRSMQTLLAVFACNRGFAFHVCQAAQAPAYDDAGRVTVLQQMIESQGLRLDPLYTRLCDLDYLPRREQIPTTVGRHPHTVAIDGGWLLDESLRAYDPDARNQIRQAVRSGLTVEYAPATQGPPREEVYRRFQPVHRQSWARTGLLPKTLEHWLKLSQAITAGGGEDLVVLVLDREGRPLAGVTCHTYQARAIYWSGCSTIEGLSSRANPLCLHGAIAACRHRGVRTFELGRFRADERSSKTRSVSDYKTQFGGDLVRVTSFSPNPGVIARTRAARSHATFEAMRRLAIALARART